MARPKLPLAAKAEFADLSSEFKDSIAQSSPEQIDKRIADLAKAEAENQRLKKEDQDLAEKKQAVKDAGEKYATDTKQYKLSMKFILQVLGDKGKA